MTHILLIHQAFISPSEAGGTRHYEIAQRFIQRGDRFTIVASDLNYLTGKRTVNHSGLVQKQNINGVDVLRAYTYPALHRSFVWRVLSFVSFMLSSIWAALKAGHVDVVFGTSPPIFQAASAWFVAFLRRRPLLLEIRDLWPEFAIDMGVLNNRVLISLSRWLERFLYARAAHIVVNSPAYRDYLRAKGVPEHKITLIPNGVDTMLFDPAADGSIFRKALNLDGKFIVTYAGALGLANDIGTILLAADRLRAEPDIHFLLVGDGKERARLEQQAKELALPNVTFAGTWPKSDIQTVLAASDACVATLLNIPMFRMTYPNKVFDYMAAQRPTLLAIDGVIRDVLEAAQGGMFVPPGNDLHLANAVRQLKDNPAQTKTMGERARAYVAAHFDREQQAAQFVDLVERLVHK